MKTTYPSMRSPTAVGMLAVVGCRLQRLTARASGCVRVERSGYDATCGSWLRRFLGKWKLLVWEGFVSKWSKVCQAIGTMLPGGFVSLLVLSYVVHL